MVWYYMVWCYIVWYGVVRYGMLWHEYPEISFPEPTPSFRYCDREVILKPYK